MARQPIWTRDGDLYAHELLYRAPDGRAMGVDLWHVDAQDLATAAVLDALREGAAYLREGRAFVNVTRSFLVDDLQLPEPHENLVLEVVETVPADPEVMEGLIRLRELGHAIALDDFAADANQVAMLPYADYVKVDCREMVRRGSALVDLARRDGATLVAERVSDVALLDRCLQLGFDLLQGDTLGAATLKHP
ncbi:EAL domain-containing protein [Cellulomonas edaphi]|uniref:EAL domain-containing protein n=1 Tax=Cellulomonas edaphi TaxID=3053468 RepID=A0ABT7S7H5_9CELL|nr:EAL domain-containing protein [Cellulomons edaphi]MDM7831565.1 EAL domain-containing protein [Cellulomons edaphi]